MINPSLHLLNYKLFFYRETQILFHLEAGYLGHMFFRYREAKEHFQTARKLSGLKVELSGEF